MTCVALSSPLVLSIIIILSCLCKPCSGSHGNECTAVKCEKKDDVTGVTMKYFSGHVIDNTSRTDGHNLLASKKLNEVNCVKECISHPQCTCVSIGKRVKDACYLFGGEDVYSNPGTMQKHMDYKLISLGNGICGTKPCANDGTCASDFETGKFTCTCRPGFKGRLCDEEAGTELHLSFDNGANDPMTTLPIIDVALKDGQIVTVPDRRGKVLVVPSGGVGMEITVNPTHTPKPIWLSAHYFDKANLTISFWLKKKDNPAGAFTEIFGVDRMDLGYNPKTKKMQINIHTEVAVTKHEFDYPPGVKWNHLYLTACGSAKIFRIYINGELAADVPLVNKAYTWASFLRLSLLGSKMPGLYLIDEFKIWRRFSETDDLVKEQYLKEKREFME